MRFVVVGDPFSLVQGGIEYHGSALAEKLVAYGHQIDWVRRKDRIQAQDFRAPDFIIVEGIERWRLLALRRAINREQLEKLLIFTHGSLYEFVHERDLWTSHYLIGTPQRAVKRLFDNIFTLNFLRTFKRVFVLSEKEKSDFVRRCSFSTFEGFSIP